MTPRSHIWHQPIVSTAPPWAECHTPSGSMFYTAQKTPQGSQHDQSALTHPGRLEGRSGSSSLTARPDRPRRLCWAPTAVAARAGAAGIKSSPVTWSTSRMFRLILPPTLLSTLTQTSCPRDKTSLALPTLQREGDACSMTLCKSGACPEADKLVALQTFLALPIVQWGGVKNK